MRVAFLVCILIFSFSSAHAVKVAFFYSKGHIKFEGEFSHVAISYKGKWLHSSPKVINGRLDFTEGVSVIPNLLGVGLEYIVLENVDLAEPDAAFYESHRDKKFNILAEWNSLTETHCSILVGKFFNISPRPMRFKSKFWRGRDVSKIKGTLGLSPSDVYTHLVDKLNFQFVSKSLFAKLNEKPSAHPTCKSFL